MPPLWLAVAILLLGGCRGVADPFELAANAGDDQALSPVSWLGNSFSGGNDKLAVQRSISDLFVRPDGSVYTYSFYKGGGYRLVIYKTGESGGERLGRASGMDVATGGNSVTVGGGYLWVDDYLDPGPRVSRLTLDGEATGRAFPIGGKDDKREVRGLAASDTELFVSEFTVGEILVFPIAKEAATAPARRWPCPRAGELALDADGQLWAIQEKTATSEARVIAFDAKTGAPLPGKEIRGLVDPRDVAITPDGRLLVAEGGPSNQIRIYLPRETPPAPAGTFGVTGGIFADSPGVPGEIAPGKLNQPNAVGMDASGTLYLNHNMHGLGARLEAYDAKGARLWFLEGLGAVFDGAALDPGAETDVYAKAFRFQMDWTQTAGREATTRAFTEGSEIYDRVAPFDPKERDSPLSSTWGVRRIDGGLFVLLTESSGAPYIAFHRRDLGRRTELAPPVLVVSKGGGGDWPPGHPTMGAWIWRDLDGNGRFSADEYEKLPAGLTLRNQWSVDDQGSIWIAAGASASQIARFSVQGLDPHGSPVVRASGVTMLTAPEPFARGQIEEMVYVKSSDTLYLAGFARGARPGDGADYGNALARFDHVSDDARRSKRWEVALGPGVSPAGDPRGFAQAGRYLFVAAQNAGLVEIRDAETDGRVVDLLRPTGPVFSDRPTGHVTAASRKNGEYVVMVDEGVYRKVILYRWNPEAPREVRAVSESDGVLVTWNPPLSGAAKGYHVWRARGGSGEFLRISRIALTGPPFSDPLPTGGAGVRYRVSAVRAEGGEAFSYEAVIDRP